IKKERLEEWSRYATVWIRKYAQDSEKFEILKELPEQAKSLTQEQKKYLHKIAEEIDNKWDPEELQKALYDWSKILEVPSKDAFAAIYAALLGKTHGPKAGWLILSLDKKFIQKRFLSL